MALTIEYSFTPLETDQRIDTESLNNLVGSLSLLLQGTISSVSISDGSVTWPKLNSALLTGGYSVAPAASVAGGDYVMIHSGSAGTLKVATVTQLLGVGLSFSSDDDWLVTDIIYGESATGTKQKGTVRGALRRWIGSATDQDQITGITSLDLTNDKAIVFDANGGSGSSGDNAAMSVANFTRSVTDRLITTAGTSTAYTLTTNDGATLVTGTTYRIKLSATCGATPTLNLNAAGAKALRKNGDTAIAAGDFTSGQILEIVYDSAANAGAGAWIVLSPFTPSEQSARAWCVFTGRVTTNDVSPLPTFDSGADTLTSTGFGSWVNGDCCFLRPSQATSGLQSSTPYYVRKQSANVVKLYTVKADAVNGTGSAVDITSSTAGQISYINQLYTGLVDASSGSLATATTTTPQNPLLRSYNVDGVIPTGESAPWYNWYVDFTVNNSSAEYAIQMTVTGDEDNDILFSVNKFTNVDLGATDRRGPTTSGFDVYSADSASYAAGRIYCTVFGA